jgi:hypothetical protein
VGGGPCVCVPLIVNTFVSECVCWRDNKHDFNDSTGWMHCMSNTHTHATERERERETIELVLSTSTRKVSHRSGRHHFTT